MKYIDLYEKLPEDDKKILNNYIDKFGITKENFIGLSSWLQNWSHSKQKLYKLLGNQFIKEIEYEYERPEIEVKKDIVYKLFVHPFKSSYHDFYMSVIKPLFIEGKMDDENRQGFSKITDIECFVTDKIQVGIKYKKEGARKTLQIQPGTKPLKALNKIVEYFKDDYTFKDFEDFRILHSMILTTKKVKGTLCLSIHPLDFITMSDNNNGWSSCMSWMDNGCYHVGTIEMMNSNNVICCYLKAENPFVFGSEEYHSWNSKRWRVLAYITKDIIMSGKPYPYKDNNLSKKVISAIKNLAIKNMDWNYTYGPELYQDMIHIDSTFSINKIHNFIKNNDTKKHNIIWNTKGMYNDMLNDHSTNYWCYRNKINKTKLLSASGKANCLCCNNSIIYLNEDYYDEYNERYDNCGSVICNSCYNNLKCDVCKDHILHESLYELKIDKGITIKLCESCFKEIVKICPCCGKPMILSDSTIAYSYDEDLPNESFDASYVSPWKENKYRYSRNRNFEYMFVCYDCFNNIKKYFRSYNVPGFLPRRRNYSVYVLDKTNISSIDPKKYFYSSLKSIDYHNKDLIYTQNVGFDIMSFT